MRRWNGRGGGAPPPPQPGRGARVGLAVVLLVTVAVSLRAAGRVIAPQEGSLIPPPFQVAHVALPVDFSGTLLYLSDTCRWCQAELASWDTTLARSGARGPWVALAPGSDPGWAARIAPHLAGPVLLDGDGSLGRALGVGAVPFRAEVATGGWVTGVTVGLSTRSERSRLILDPPATDSNPPGTRP